VRATGDEAADAEASSSGAHPRTSASLREIAVEAGLCAFATLLNPYTWRLWTVPFALSSLVRGATFYNPEWLRPPLVAFPIFYISVGLLVIAACADALERRVPDGSILVALVFAALSALQMRHMGLFAVSLLFAGPALIERAHLMRGRLARALSAPGPVTVAAVGALLAAGALLWGSWRVRPALALEPLRFPVEAAEWVAREEPAVRLYNDVQFGGYLIWRFFPGRQVFIDGRNELYADLLPRLARIHTGELPYAAWRGLIADFAIEGAIVKYNPSRTGVVYPPRNPGQAPSRGYRAWSAVLFPSQEWALVYFDDTAMVFVKRGGRAERWATSWEYHELNPDDADYVLEKAARDPAFARRLRAELLHRLAQSPRSQRAERFLEALGG
jgi:hypothetical protein